MPFVTYLIIGVSSLARAIVDILLGRRRRMYEAAVTIEAPRTIVWDTITAREATFKGLVPVMVKVAPSPGDPALLRGTVTMGEIVMPIVYREISGKPGEAGVIEILTEETDKRIAPGRDYYVAYTLTDETPGPATRLSIRHELTHSDFVGRIAIPIGVYQNARRMKSHCEKLAGKQAPAANRLRSALVTGALTYASFLYLFGWQSAAVLLALIFIHEAGHALAMRMVGQPVQGIYFVPFFGGVAVAGAPHRNQAERGFVALMGPGFSLITTAVFYLLWSMSDGDPLLGELVLASAILNGLNLAPVLPLDGGHVIDAILSRADPEVAAFLNFGALLAGIGASVYFEWYVLTALLMLYAPFAVMGSRSQRPANPISPASQTWLVAAYLGTIAFYVTIATRFLG
jgi:Zn-dependent protease